MQSATETTQRAFSKKSSVELRCLQVGLRKTLRRTEIPISFHHFAFGRARPSKASDQGHCNAALLPAFAFKLVRLKHSIFSDFPLGTQHKTLWQAECCQTPLVIWGSKAGPYGPIRSCGSMISGHFGEFVSRFLLFTCYNDYTIPTLWQKQSPILIDLIGCIRISCYRGIRYLIAEGLKASRLGSRL